MSIKPKGYLLAYVRAPALGMAALMWGLCSVSAQAQQVSTTYIYSDPQGTPLAEADAAGTVTASFEYTPFGIRVNGIAPNGPGYASHVSDADSNFVYMQARYYDPATGRFLSVDPVLPEAGNYENLNRYLYASGNPVLNVDPTGRAPSASPLLQLKMWGNYFKQMAGQLMVDTGIAMKDRIQVTVEGGAGRGGLGANLSHDFVNGGNQVSALVAASGAAVSANVKLRLFTVKIPYLASEGKVSYTAHASFYDEIGAAGDLTLDPNGAVSAYFSVGAGVGSLAYLGSIDYNLSPTL